MSSEIAPTGALAVTEREILSTKEVVRQHTTLLYRFYAKRNSLLPVSRLPPELITTIFIHGARDYYESYDGGGCSPQIPSWVNVSYVCSHWRNIALDCPTLWTYYFNTSLRWTKELLLRSREAPLQISCFYPYDRYDEVSRWKILLDELLKHSERIQELYLHVPPWFLPPKLFLCVPHIEKLDIYLLSDDSDQSIAITDECMPPLHTLKLANCTLPWYLLNLNKLEALLLHCVHTPSPLDMVKFLAVLSSMQNITILDLYRVLPSARDFLSSGGLGNHSKIDLPNLAYLVIAEPLSRLVPFLSCVNIPPQAALNLEPRFESGSSLDAFVPISSFLAQRFSPQSSGPIFHSVLIRAGDYMTSLIFGLECEPPTLPAVGRNIPLEITLMVEDEVTRETVLAESDTDHITGNIFSSLPLTTIQGLHITESRQFSSDLWRGILGRLDGLRYMKLSHGYMPDLSLLSLVRGSNEDLDDVQPIPDQDMTSCHMFVPALEKLELHRITFTSDHISRAGRMSQRTLLDTLFTRKRLRGRLAMTECRVTQDE